MRNKKRRIRKKKMHDSTTMRTTVCSFIAVQMAWQNRRDSRANGLLHTRRKGRVDVDVEAKHTERPRQHLDFHKANSLAWKS